MSLLDTYRRNAARKQDEIARLLQLKAKEHAKIATLSSKITSASKALSKAKNVSTINSKSREIEKFHKEHASSDKKISELEKKLSGKQKELSNELRKASKEEEKETKKRQTDLDLRAKSQQADIHRINMTLDEHDGLHQATIENFRLLQSLPEKIVVLFLAANPINEQQLRLDEEARLITEMIRKAKHRDSIAFESRWAVQTMDVLQAINELNPTIVHFSGHGSDSDEIVFQDNNGNAKLVSKEAIVQLMMACSGNIRLVFFNTCYSFRQASAVTCHVDAAIGMNASIGDEAARIFSSQFYAAIGFGLSVGKAFEQAKALLMMNGLNEVDTPQLFIQDGIDPLNLIIVRPPN